ncbi:antibiotic biosynthesis monooxygenase [Paenibacillus sp. KN14-4R]|uniref:antibiotic biosynthesis monooxygenase n=1 Tax=Paenibacillus sp. KN14-4R TaxID=3445773 RepID=UPI003FA09F86
MIIVTNTIQVKLGFGDKIIEGFKQAKGVQSFKGFVRLEVLRTEGLEENEEIKVNTTWESKEDFQVWVTSDSFKQSHSRQRSEGAGNGDGEKKESPVLSSKISYHEIVITHLPQQVTAGSEQ